MSDVPRHVLRFFDCVDFLACALCVKIIEQILERGKIVVALYAIIDCDIAYISFHEKDFRIVVDFQIVVPRRDISLTMIVAIFLALIPTIVRLRLGLSNVMLETPLLMKNIGFVKRSFFIEYI